MLGGFGDWVARAGVITFTIIGFMYVSDGLVWGDGGEVRRSCMTAALIAFLNAAVFFVGDQITTAIRSLQRSGNYGDD